MQFQPCANSQSTQIQAIQLTITQNWVRIELIQKSKTFCTRFSLAESKRRRRTVESGGGEGREMTRTESRPSIGYELSDKGIQAELLTLAHFHYLSPTVLRGPLWWRNQNRTIIKVIVVDSIQNSHEGRRMNSEPLDLNTLLYDWLFFSGMEWKEGKKVTWWESIEWKEGWIFPSQCH